jgi:hypothetical protein
MKQMDMLLYKHLDKLTMGDFLDKTKDFSLGRMIRTLQASIHSRDIIDTMAKCHLSTTE